MLIHLTYLYLPDNWNMASSRIALHVDWIGLHRQELSASQLDSGMPCSSPTLHVSCFRIVSHTGQIDINLRHLLLHLQCSEILCKPILLSHQFYTEGGRGIVVTCARLSLHLPPVRPRASLYVRGLAGILFRQKVRTSSIMGIATH